MNLITDNQITWNSGPFSREYDTIKVVQGERKWYRHGDETFATKSALRRTLSSEYNGAWIEEKDGKRRCFIEDGWIRRSVREVSKEEFVCQLGTPSTWQKVLGLGLGILALAPGVSECIRHVPKEAGLGLLSMQQKNPLLGILAMGIFADAQAVGTEFQVNRYILGNQTRPRAATLLDGGVIVVWEGEGQNDDDGLYGRILESNGSFFGSEFEVNNYTLNQQWDPSVKVLTDGRFIIVWDSFGQDGDLGGIFGQIFFRNGTRFGSEFQLNTITQSQQEYPSVAPLNDGGFIGVWDNSGSGANVFGKRFAEDGGEIGLEFQVNSYTNGDQWYPSADSLISGEFVVVWHSNGQLNGFDIFGQRFDANATTIGTEFLVNNYTIGDQYAPNIASLADGGFVVVWSSDGQDGDAAGVFGQRYDANGTALNGEFQANNYTLGRQWYPRVGALLNGGFVVVWTSRDGQDGSNGGCYGQLFNTNGLKIGQEFLINTFTDGYQGSQSIVGLNDGGFIIFWSSFGQDGNGSGIFGQRYDASGIPIPLEIQHSTSVSANIRASISAIFSVIDVVYLQQYPITQNGQTIGTFSFSGGTGQINSTNPNVLNIQFNPGFAPEEEEFIPLFSIPSDQAGDWQGIQLGDTDFECLEAHTEINPSTDGGSDFGLIFTGAGSCTSDGSQIIAGILPLMMH